MEQLHEVIIIGAGISGIGASRILSAQNIPHIIIQSRDRYGGRIYPNQFAGITVDVGATFIHDPNQFNEINKFVQSQGCQCIQASKEDQYYYQGTGQLQDSVIERVNQLYDQAYKQADKKAEEADYDISLAQAFEDFIKEELDGEEPSVRDTVLWKLKIQGNVEGAELSELSAKKQSLQQKKCDIIPANGGYPMIFQRLFKTCKTQVKFNTRVLTVDYSGPNVILKTTNGVYAAKRVISSLPLGVLQLGKVHFVPSLPGPYLSSILTIGNGIQNKLFVLMKQPFWQNQSGWINFVTKSQYNRYPIAFIYPNAQNKPIILVFVAGKAGREVGEWTDQQVGQDFQQFLTQFIDPSLAEIEEVKMSRWHKDENSLGSYCFNRIGTKKEHFLQLRKPLQNKFWFIGEHTHPVLSSYAHGAYETGMWAAKEVIHLMKGGDLQDLQAELQQKQEDQEAECD